MDQALTSPGEMINFVNQQSITGTVHNHMTNIVHDCFVSIDNQLATLTLSGVTRGLSQGGMNHRLGMQ